MKIGVNNMRKTKLIIRSTALAMCVAVCFMSCKKNQAESGAGTEAVQATFAVTSYKVEYSTLDDYLEFGGDVDSVSSVAVMPDQAGKISALYVKVGDKVYKNQELVAVDASRPGMVFAPSPVRAPVAGTVTSLPGVIGTSVAQSSIVARIASTNELEVTTSIPERYVSRIEMNQRALISFDAYPSETFEAHIKEISPVLDNSTRAMAVKLAIDTRDAKIKAGMYAKIHLITEHKESVTVLPYGTVVSKNNQSYVFRVVHNGDDSRVTVVPVKVGIRVDNLQEILEGIKVGDEIVTKGQSLLGEGSKVNVVSVANN